MKKLLLALGLLLGGCLAAQAQVGCTSVGGVNSVPQIGLNCNQEPTIPTYTAVANQLLTATNPTDIACIGGSPTKVVRIQEVRISGFGTSMSVVPVLITLRTTQDTGGTLATASASMISNTIDTSNPASSIGMSAWTVNPTINSTTSAYIDIANLTITPSIIIGTNTSTIAPQPFTIFDWQERNFEQAPILRGVAQNLCINLNATAISSLFINAQFKWTEAPL